MSMLAEQLPVPGKVRLAGRDVIHRWEGNPIISLEDIPFECNTVFNAGAVKLPDQYLLLVRVEDKRGRSIFAMARSVDGYRFAVDPEPVMTPSDEEPFATYEARGIEDPRITPTDGSYYIMYTAHSHFGPRLALAQTDDFKTFQRIALVSEPMNKNGVGFFVQ